MIKADHRVLRLYGQDDLAFFCIECPRWRIVVSYDRFLDHEVNKAIQRAVKHHMEAA